MTTGPETDAMCDPAASTLGAEWMRRKVHSRIAKVSIASCRCGSKTFDADWHLDGCPYKVLSQVDGMVECIPGPTHADLLAEAARVVMDAWQSYENNVAQKYEQHLEDGGPHYLWQPDFTLDWLRALAALPYCKPEKGGA